MKICKKDFFRIVARHPVRYFGPVGTVKDQMAMLKDFLDVSIIGFWKQRKKLRTIQEMTEILAIAVTNNCIRFSDGSVYTHQPYTKYRKIALPNNEGSIFIAKYSTGEQCWYYVNVL